MGNVTCIRTRFRSGLFSLIISSSLFVFALIIFVAAENTATRFIIVFLGHEVDNDAAYEKVGNAMTDVRHGLYDVPQNAVVHVYFH